MSIIGAQTRSGSRGMGLTFDPAEAEVYRSKYRLSAAPPGAVTPGSMILGLLWPEGWFDPAPDRDGRTWLRLAGAGRPVGGHAVCLRARDAADARGWHPFYDQGGTPHCAGFAAARVSSLNNRRRYDGHALYAAAKRSYDPGGEGTTLNAVCRVLKEQGPPLPRTGRQDAAHGIASFWWLDGAAQVLAWLGWDDEGAVPVLNSWSGWPREAWIAGEDLDALMRAFADGRGYAEVVRPVDRVGPNAEPRERTER